MVSLAEPKSGMTGTIDDDDEPDLEHDPLSKDANGLEGLCVDLAGTQSRCLEMRIQICQNPAMVTG